MILNILKETYQVLKQNKIRTALTGLTVAWGIFMLISLLGYTNGLINGFTQNMGNASTNCVVIFEGQTTMEHGGHQAGRLINFTQRDIYAIKNMFSGQIAGDVKYYARKTNSIAKTLSEYFSTIILGTFPGQNEIDGLDVKDGRYINEADIRLHRKVAVLTENARKMLFKDRKNVVGETIEIDGIVYHVVGIVGRKMVSNESSIHIPITTFYNIYEDNGRISMISFLTKGLTTEESNKEFVSNLRKMMAKLHNFNEDDKSAIWIQNRFSQRVGVEKATSILTITAWVIGLLSLISGIVGVSNIMFISVKERTHEIGVRRAIGAKPRNIYMMIMIESVAITTFFGYLGMVAGVAMNEVASYYAELHGTNDLGLTMFSNPTVGMDIAIEATITMIAAGVIAGILPARKATKVRPVEALMDE